MAGEFAKFAGMFPIERAESAEGATPPITLEEFAQAELAVEEALRGNAALLAERLGTGKALPIECVVAAAILEKKLRKPSHRPADQGMSGNRFLLAFDVNELMRGGEPEKSAVSKVAQAAGVSISSVRKATEAWPWSVAPWK
jgi:hypothetical protein